MIDPKITYANENQLSRIIRDLSNHICLDNQGRTTWTITFEVDAQFEILAHIVRVAGLDDIDVMRSLTQAAIKKIKERGKTATLESFKELFSIEVQEYLDKPEEEFKVVFFLNVNERALDDGVVNLLGTQIEAYRWQELENNFETKPWLDNVEVYRVFKLGELRSFTFTPMLATAKGRTPSEGFYNAEDVISLYRAVLNLSHEYGSRTVGGHPPLGKCLPSPVYGLFQADGKYLDLFYTLSRYRYQPESFHTQKLKRIDILQKLKRSSNPNDTMFLVLDSLRKYGQAMDAIQWHAAFLPFWQVLELAALQTDTIKISSVVSRTKSLLRTTPLIEDLIIVLNHCLWQ